MEFLPIEKYSIDRKTAKHKKDIKRSKVKAVPENAKTEERVNTIKTRNFSEKESEANNSQKPVCGLDRENIRTVTCPTKNKIIPRNRLFVKLKKKIVNVQEVKDLHPDIKSVILPRKKCSSWCWAVFGSVDEAVKALKVLDKRNNIIVKQVYPEEIRKEKKEKKLNKVRIKKSMKGILRDTWL